MQRLVIKLFKNQYGTVTLEAMLAFPVLLALILSFVNIIQIYTIKFNLQSVNSELVREISANWPISKVVEYPIPAKFEYLLNSKYGQLFLRKSIPVNLLLNKYTERPIHPDRIAAIILKLPNDNSDQVSIKLKYKFRIIVPFVRKTMTIQTRATETVWGK